MAVHLVHHVLRRADGDQLHRRDGGAGSAAARLPLRHVLDAGVPLVRLRMGHPQLPRPPGDARPAEAARSEDLRLDQPVHRTAVATGTIRMSREAFQQVADQAVAKGDVLAVSEVAGTLAAKKTAELIPLCHPLGLDHVEVEASLAESLPGVRIWATVRAVGRTGVEMEALTAVAVALLTVYDMVKAVDAAMVVSDVQLVEKKKVPVDA